MKTWCRDIAMFLVNIKWYFIIIIIITTTMTAVAATTTTTTTKKGGLYRQVVYMLTSFLNLQHIRLKKFQVNYNGHLKRKINPLSLEKAMIMGVNVTAIGLSYYSTYFNTDNLLVCNKKICHLCTTNGNFI